MSGTAEAHAPVDVSEPVVRPPRPTALGRALDWLYRAAGAVSAVFMVLLLGLILAQMATRWAGVTFPGGTAYAGYASARKLAQAIA